MSESNKKMCIEMTIRNEERVIGGHLFIYANIEEIGYKNCDLIDVLNPYTRKIDKCKIIDIQPSEDTKTGEKGTVIHFKEPKD